MTPHSRTLLSYLHHLAAPSAPDAVLLTRWIDQRDESAFSVLMARHGPMVLGVCRRVLGDVQDAEDAFQATFLVLARQAAKLRRPEALASFLYGIALRLARKARAAAKRRPKTQTTAGIPEPVDPQPHVLDALSGRELLALVDAEIARLPEVYRLPLLLCLLQGRTIEEAARQLGWTIGSLRGRLERGREQLRQRLTRRGIGLSVGALALLTPAVVPEKLLAESVRHLSGTVPAAISVLAAGSALALKKVACVLFMLVAATGVSLVAVATPRQSPPVTPASPPAQAKDEPRRDRYGDPLPEGAIARLGTLRFRVDADIQGVAFAPDDKTIAVRGNGGVWILDSVSGKQIRRIDSSDSLTPGIAISPDGKQLIASCRVAEKDLVRSVVNFRYVVRVWETASGRKVIESDVNEARWVGWSADGQPLAAYIGKGEMRLRDMATGRERRFAAKDLPDPIRSQVCSCVVGKKDLVASDENGFVHIWSLDDGKERCVVKTGGEYVRSLALSPDGRSLASLSCNNGRYLTHLWDTSTGNIRHAIAEDQKWLDTLAFAPDGKTLATLGWSEIRFWDTNTGRQTSRIQSASGSFGPSVAFSCDSKMLATSVRYGRAIHLWDATKAARKAQPEGHGSRAGPASFSPDGQRVATTSNDGTIRIWNAASSEALVRIHRGGGIRDCTFSADGRTLYSLGTGDKLYFDDAASGRERHVVKVENPDRPKPPPSGLWLHVSEDRERLLVSSSCDNREVFMTGYDASTRKQVFQRKCLWMELGHAVSADGRVLAAPHPTPEGEKGAAMGPMRLEDVRTGERLLMFPALEGQTWPLAFSPDGRLLASTNFNWKRKDKKGDPAGATGQALHLLETATASEVLQLPLAGQCRTAFSPDGTLLAQSAPGQEIVVWDLLLGRERQRFKGFNAEVTSLRFSPDGHRLVSGLSDSTLLMWDVRGRERNRVGKLSVEAVSKAWTDLAGNDSPRAFRARWALASTPEEAMPLLTKHLHPVTSADPQRLRRLLSDLDSEQFAVREKAQAELETLGDLAEPMLRKTLENKPTLEVRKRVQAILEHLHGPVTKPEQMQSLRAVAVLEDIGTPPARRLLAELAKGAPEARLTREAKASLRRLDIRRLHLKER